MWNKALAAWTLAGLLIPLLLLFPGLLKRSLTVRKCALAVVFFAIGAFPFIRYNVRHRAATVEENVKVTLADVAPKAHLMYETLRGYSMMEYIAYEPKGPTRWTFIPHALLASMILLLIWPSRLGWYPLAAGSIVFLLMAVTRNAGGAVHHLVLVWPFQYWAIAAAFTAPKIQRQTFAWVAVALLALDNARVLNIYRDALIHLGSPRSWSAAIYPLADRVKALHPRLVQINDWGYSDNLALLTHGSVTPAWNDRPYKNFHPDDVWVIHTDQFQEFMPRAAPSSRSFACSLSVEVDAELLQLFAVELLLHQVELFAAFRNVLLHGPDLGARIAIRLVLGQQHLGEALYDLEPHLVVGPLDPDLARLLELGDDLVRKVGHLVARKLHVVVRITSAGANDLVLDHQLILDLAEHFRVRDALLPHVIGILAQ
jgi:hypothetical protein